MDSVGVPGSERESDWQEWEEQLVGVRLCRDVWPVGCHLVQQLTVINTAPLYGPCKTELA